MRLRAVIKGREYQDKLKQLFALEKKLMLSEQFTRRVQVRSASVTQDAYIYLDLYALACAEQRLREGEVEELLAQLREFEASNISLSEDGE